MKPKINTSSLQTDVRTERISGCDGNVTAILVTGYEIIWFGGGEFARIIVEGSHSEFVANSIRRFLLHKFPARIPDP